MTSDINEKPDFHIFFLPRSGSHMLVNALNSHPEINCSHSDQGHQGKGALRGHAQCVLVNDKKKKIILTRNAKDRTDSFFTDIANVIGTNHAYKPCTISMKYPEKAENRYLSQEKKTAQFIEDAEKLENTLFVAYEDITGNQDIREIPEQYSHEICDFLGVERRILTTKLHKPTVTGKK